VTDGADAPLAVVVTASDRAAAGEYDDVSGSLLVEGLRALGLRVDDAVVVPDGMPVERALRRAVADGAALVLTTGGTGLGPRDLTPEAMRQVITKELPGFGELMRKVSLERVPTAILSRQTAGIRGRSLIVNLPGKPASIEVCLEAVFPAVPYCLELIGAGMITTNPAVLQCYRPQGR